MGNKVSKGNSNFLEIWIITYIGVEIPMSISKETNYNRLTKCMKAISLETDKGMNFPSHATNGKLLSV